MIKGVRVRFAPSPTGSPHIGNIRTALFTWLFARHHSGTFILRIEDTDRDRIVPGALEEIMEALRWLGLDWDEGPEVGGPYGPYLQSQRVALYQKHAWELMEKGYAYTCYCSPERLDAMRKEQQARRQPPGYDRRCRNLSPAERHNHEAQGIKPVVRFKVPPEGQTSFTDLLRGAIVFDNSTIDDFVILKSDGYPTYHLANVVDDHAMEITHVLRADEWIPSTPRHILLYQAFGWEPPLFGHLPIILGPDRSKLSKRHGATSATWYREQGYLPEAVVNFLALLGWSYDATTEIFSRDELVKHFTLERVGVTGAVFSVDKLEWMDGYYIRQLSVEDLAERLLPFLQRDGLLPPGEVTGELKSRSIGIKQYIRSIVPLIHERLKRLNEVGELTSFFFRDELEYESKLLISKGMSLEDTIRALQSSKSRLEEVPSFSKEELEPAFRRLAEELGLKTGQLFMTLRVAITGRTVSPPLFETMEVLGRERTRKRTRAALELIEAAKGSNP